MLTGRDHGSRECARAGDDRRRPAGRRVPPDGVAGAQRPPQRPAGDRPPGPGGDRRARLPAQPRRPGAGHRAQPAARRRRAEHHACSARRRCSTRVRAGRRRGGLRGQRGQRAPTSTGASISAVVERHLDQRVAGHRGHRPGRPRRTRRSTTLPTDIPLVTIDGDPHRPTARASPSTRRPAPALATRAPARRRAPHGLARVRARRTGSTAPAAIGGWERDAARRRAPRCRR